MRIFLLCALIVFAAPPLHAFEVKEVQAGQNLRFLKWNAAKGPVRLVLNSRGSADIPIVSTESALRAAMDSWQNAPGHSLRLEYGGTNPAAASNNTDMINSVLWMEQGWPYGPSIMAVTRFSYFQTDPPELADADILINGQSFKWSVAPNSTTHPQRVLLHEIGHMLGLSHSSVASSVMHPSYGPGKPGPLTPDERAAMQFLYGAPVVDFRQITPLPGAVYSEQMAEKGLPLPVFRWGNTGPGSTYEIEFSNTPSFQKKVKFAAGTRNSFQPNATQEKQIQALSPQKLVQWRVTAGAMKTPSRAVRFRPPGGPIQAALLRVGVDQNEVEKVRNILLAVAAALLLLGAGLIWRHRSQSRKAA